MRTHLHADDVGPWPARTPVADVPLADLPTFKPRPPWLIFLAKHFAPRNHERWQLQGSEIPQEVWDRAFPPLTDEERARLQAAGVRFGTGASHPAFKPIRKRPWWLAFLYRHRLLHDDE